MIHPSFKENPMSEGKELLDIATDQIRLVRTSEISAMDTLRRAHVIGDYEKSGEQEEKGAIILAGARRFGLHSALSEAISLLPGINWINRLTINRALDLPFNMPKPSPLIEEFARLDKMFFRQGYERVLRNARTKALSTVTNNNITYPTLENGAYVVFIDDYKEQPSLPTYRVETRVLRGYTNFVAVPATFEGPQRTRTIDRGDEVIDKNTAFKALELADRYYRRGIILITALYGFGREIRNESLS